MKLGDLCDLCHLRGLFFGYIKFLGSPNCLTYATYGLFLGGVENETG